MVLVKDEKFVLLAKGAPTLLLLFYPKLWERAVDFLAKEEYAELSLDDFLEFCG